MSGDEKKKLQTKIKEIASQGFRVLGIAIGLDGANMKDITTENFHDQLSDATKY